MRKLIFFISFVLELLFCNQVMAWCGYTYTNTYTTTNMTIGSTYVQRDTPIGTVISTSSATVQNGTNQLYQCDFQWTWQTLMGVYTNQSSLGGGVYDTNIKGVGIRITDTFRNLIAPATRTNSATSAVANTPFKVELIKTSNGAVDSGLLQTGAIIYMKSISDGVTFAQLNLTGANPIIPVLCAITTPNLTFPIGNVLANNFGTSVGAIPTGGQNTQNLGLNCDPQANINVMLTGTQNQDVGTTSVLALTGQGNADVASGVGVQLVYNGSPLVLNNRVVLKKSAGGQETFPITARYYQTKTSVTTGKANASATLDLTYQ